MSVRLPGKFNCVAIVALTMSALASSGSALAEADWYSFTMDNDTFVGNDNGYTNGMYFTWYDTPDNNKPEPGFLARAMLWSLPDSSSSTTDFSLGTIGQTMITPDDIEEDPPILPPDDLPYGGLLFYSDSFARVHDRYADKIAVTIGVVGEPSLADETQDFVHDVISSDEPCCWDDQLDDEVVFQVSRARFWRTWVSDGGSSDLLLGADLALGTISSSVGASFMVRYGAHLDRSYATALLANGRTANPVATQNGWYVFAGARAGYLGNQIFLDTSKSYDDDFEEIDYQEDTVAITLGLAYSWKEWSFTFALNDLNVNEDEDAAEEYSEYGTFTLAWKTD
jgi:lipid A 3-O-deacylase